MQEENTLTVMVDFEVTDDDSGMPDIESGFARGILIAIHPSTGNAITFEFTTEEDLPDHPGQFRLPISFPKNSQTGDYEIQVLLTDEDGNTNTDPIELGTVTNEEDTEAPTLTSVELPLFNAPLGVDNYPVTVTATDNMSGIDYGTIEASHEDGASLGSTSTRFDEPVG